MYKADKFISCRKDPKSKYTLSTMLSGSHFCMDGHDKRLILLRKLYMSWKLPVCRKHFHKTELCCIIVHAITELYGFGNTSLIQLVSRWGDFHTHVSLMNGSSALVGMVFCEDFSWPKQIHAQENFRLLWTRSRYFSNSAGNALYTYPLTIQSTLVIICIYTYLNKNINTY